MGPLPLLPSPYTVEKVLDDSSRSSSPQGPSPPSPHSVEKVPGATPQSSSPHGPSPPPVPATADLLAACIYPLTLIAGSLFSTLSPSDASSNSYFSKKKNILNVLFVKNGWFWTTLVFLIHLTRLRSSRTKALIRYSCATLWWVAVAQWFFGPPIMDRTFTFTGGNCEAIATDPSLRENMSPTTLAITSATCKVAGGRWRGGHDLSGHTFLLTHASLFLWSELLPVLTLEAWRWETHSVLGLLFVWWWMLLMTGVYFHTWREKLTGWIVSLVEWVVLYVWALRTQPQARSLVGVPGV